MIKVSTLKLKDRNPRKITEAALNKLAESIQRDPEFMILRPIVIDEHREIIGGNQRLKAIKKIGMKEIPDGWVVEARNLTAEQKRRFLIVDNAPAGMAGEWDFEILSVDWAMPELEAWGFDAGTLEKFFGDSDMDVLNSDGNLSGSQYGLAGSKTRVPVNILGVGGLVDRDVMERFKQRLINDGAIEGEDNGQVLAEALLRATE